MLNWEKEWESEWERGRKSVKGSERGEGGFKKRGSMVKLIIDPYDFDPSEPVQLESDGPI